MYGDKVVAFFDQLMAPQFASKPFVAFSQWGNTIFGIMSRLSEDGGDSEVRNAFHKTMTGEYDNANGEPFTPLELFVMELFRTISPNGGCISAIQDARTSAYGESPHKRFGLPFERNSYISTPHTSTSLSPIHWKNPEQFDPERYRSVPTSASTITFELGKKSVCGMLGRMERRQVRYLWS
jgi:hypothetical protein